MSNPAPLKKVRAVAGSGTDELVANEAEYVTVRLPPVLIVLRRVWKL